MYNLKQHIFLVFLPAVLCSALAVAAAFDSGALSESLKDAEAGIAAMRENRYFDGTNFFNKVYLSGNPEALNEVGSWYAENGQLQVAIDFFTRAAKNEDFSFDRAVALNNLGTLYIKLQRPGEAKKNLKQAHTFFCSLLLNDAGAEKIVSSILHNLGCVYINTGKEQKGLNYLRRSAENIECKETLYNIANILLAHEELEAAKHLLLRITRMGALPVLISDVANNLGVICYKQNDFAQARIYFERSARFGSPIGSANLTLLQNALHKRQIVRRKTEVHLLL